MHKQEAQICDILRFRVREITFRATINQRAGAYRVDFKCQRAFLGKGSIKQALIYPADDFLLANCSAIYHDRLSTLLQRVGRKVGSTFGEGARPAPSSEKLNLLCIVQGTSL